MEAVPEFVPNRRTDMLTPKKTRVLTIIGLLVPLEAVGSAVVMDVDNQGIAAAAQGGGLGGRLGDSAGDDDGDGVSSMGATTGSGSEAGGEPETVLPVSPGQPDVNPEGAPPGVISSDPPPGAGQGGGTTGVTFKPAGPNPKVGSSAFIGNVGWVAPGVMTNMANSIWQESKAAKNPQIKTELNSEAVVEYLGNYSAVLTSYNDALLTQTDNSSIQNLLSVLAGGSFIEALWSQAIFETALSADVVSRQINTAWQSKSYFRSLLAVL